MPTDDERFSRLEARVAELEDEREIRELLATYGYSADMGAHDGFVGLFTEDGAMELHGGEPSGTYADIARWQGHAELREFIQDPRVHLAIQGRCMHLPTINLRTRIDGDDAIAETCALVLVIEDGRTIINGAGFTRWRLRRVDGSWRIEERLRHAVGTDEATLAQSLASEWPSTNSL